MMLQLGAKGVRVKLSYSTGSLYVKNVFQSRQRVNV